MKEHNSVKVILIILSMICIMFVIQCDDDNNTGNNNPNDNYKKVTLEEDEQGIILNKGQIQRTVNTEDNIEKTVSINKYEKIITFPKNPISEVMTDSYYFKTVDGNEELHNLTINFDWKINDLSTYYISLGSNLNISSEIIKQIILVVIRKQALDNNLQDFIDGKPSLIEKIMKESNTEFSNNSFGIKLTGIDFSAE